MKTRIIQTRFWDDLFVSESDLYTQHLYIYLLTSQYINISGIFQLTENKIKFEAKLTDNQFESAKNNLEKAGKVLFKDGWVCVKNAEKNNGYRNSPKNETAYEKELSLVPKEIMEYFDTTMDSSIDGSIHTNHKSKIINHKSKNINNKYSDLKDLKEEDFLEISERYGVPVSFVHSKYDDLINWVEGKPTRGRGRNFRMTLMAWVKKDAIELRQKGKDLAKRKGGVYDARSNRD